MIKLYKYGTRYSSEYQLMEYEAIRETEHFWIFDDSGNRWNKRGERREPKREYGVHKEYHLTPESAIKAVIDYLKREKEAVYKKYETICSDLLQAEKDIATLKVKTP